MTFPGVQGVIGPGWLSTTGFPVRQSRAGAYPGGSSPYTSVNAYATVLDSMGSYAPPWGILAESVTVAQETIANPFPINQQDFEKDFDKGNPDVGTPADYTGLPTGSPTGNNFPLEIPYDFP